MSPDRARYLSQFPLRLARSLRESAKALAERDGISLNHFISLAIAEKISRLEQQGQASPIDAFSEQDDRARNRSVD
jgi:HicB-like protein involved in pilus formation